MIKGKIAKTGKNLVKGARKNSPEILTWLGVSGVITTTALAIKATPKALMAIEEVEQQNIKNRDVHDKDLTKIEVVKIAWKYYIPTVLSGAATIACVIGSNKILSKRNAILAGLYSVAELSLKEYQEKVVEMIGKNKEGKVREALAEDALRDNPVSSKEIIITGKGEILLFEPLSGRYFKSELEQVRKAINDFNFELLQEMFKPLNELYYLWGLSDTETGKHLGWQIEEGVLSVDFTTKMADNGQPCVVLNINPRPNKYAW